MHLGDGTDSADKVNGDEALEINVVVARGLEDGYANVLFVQGNNGLCEEVLAWMAVDDEGEDSAFRMGNIQDTVLDDKGGLHPKTAHACGCKNTHAVFYSQ